jgi:hypothetical protein
MKLKQVEGGGRWEVRYLDEPEQGQFTQVGAVVEECQFEEAPDEAQQGEVHDVAETLAEPAVGEIQRPPDTDDAGGVDQQDGGGQQGGHSSRPSGR